jgi:hypothetical protein
VPNYPRRPCNKLSFVGIKAIEYRLVAYPGSYRRLGWDIAISEEGPVLVEDNERWPTSLIQMPAPHGLLTGEFKALYEALSEGEVV